MRTVILDMPSGYTELKKYVKDIDEDVSYLSFDIEACMRMLMEQVVQCIRSDFITTAIEIDKPLVIPAMFSHKLISSCERLKDLVKEIIVQLWFKIRDLKILDYSLTYVSHTEFSLKLKGEENGE